MHRNGDAPGGFRHALQVAAWADGVHQGFDALDRGVRREDGGFRRDLVPRNPFDGHQRPQGRPKPLKHMAIGRTRLHFR